MAEEGVVISCHTADTWNEQLLKHKGSQKLVVVDFTASWCGPCKVISPIFAELAKKITNATFLKVDVDELQTIAEEYSVEAMPTFLFLKDGEVVEKFAGANKVKLEELVTKHAAASA